MANVKFTKPQNIGRLFYSYWDGSAWSTHVEVTDTFLNDTTKGHVGTVSGLASLSDNLVEKDRFIMYYGTYVNGVWTPASGTLDCIALVNMTQISGLTLLTYADDSIDIGSVPTTLIDTHVQSAGSGLYSTKSELIEFTEETAECFMVERQGIASYNAGSSAPNLILNGDFETGDFTSWTESGTDPDVHSSFGTTGNGEYYANLRLDDEEIEQTISTGGVEVEAKLSFETWDIGNMKIFVDGAVTGSLINQSVSANSIEEYAFTIGASETAITVKFDVITTAPNEFDDVDLTITTGAVYTGSPLDTRAIVFGGDALQPTRNFENGQEQDDSNKWSTNITNSSSYQTKTNSIRKDMLQFELFSDAQKQLLQDLDKELNEGLCIYQRDGDSTDDNEWFVGRFMIQPNTAQFTDLNSIQASVTELAARET